MLTSTRTDNPHDIYRNRIRKAHLRLARLTRRFEQLANLRLAVALAGIVLAVVALSSPAVAATWLYIPVAIFLGLVIAHARSERGRRRAALQVEFYERGLSRLENTWQGTGIASADFAAEDHPFAADLDLFGPASLFELLCTARTRAGEDVLARWLLQPAGHDEIASRREAIQHLQPDLDLREELALLGGGVRARVDPALLTNWGEAPPSFSKLTTLLLRVGAFIGSAGLITSFVLWILQIWGPCSSGSSCSPSGDSSACAATGFSAPSWPWRNRGANWAYSPQSCAGSKRIR